MAGIELGSLQSLTWTPPGGGDAIVTIVEPDGTVTTPDVAAGPTVTAEFTPTKPGRHTIRWTTAAAAFTDVLDVWPEDPRFIVSLADIRELVVGGRAIDGPDNTLRLYSAAATEVVESIYGPVLPKTTEQRADGGTAGVKLYAPAPRATLVVMVDGATLVEDEGYIYDESAGIVYAGGRYARFPQGRQNIRITYQAGSAEIPNRVRVGTLELIKHNYQVGQQAVHANFAGGLADDDMIVTDDGYYVTKRVWQLLRAPAKFPGIA